MNLSCSKIQGVSLLLNGEFVTKCAEYASECEDSSSNYYCSTECQTDPSGSGCNQTTCNNCKNKQQSNASMDAILKIQLDQCYSLENYKGKVANIDSDNSFSNQELALGTLSQRVSTLYSNISNSGTNVRGK